MSQLALVHPLILQIKEKKKKRKTIFKIKEKKRKRKRNINIDLAVLPSHDTTIMTWQNRLSHYFLFLFLFFSFRLLLSQKVTTK